MYKKSIVMAIMIALTVIGCQQDNHIVTDSQSLQNEQDLKIDVKTQEKIDHLAKLYKISVDSVWVSDKYLNVGHCAYEKEDFWKKYHFNKNDNNKNLGAKSYLRLWDWEGGSKVTRLSAVTINIKPNVPQAWRDAFIYAVQQWNDLRLDISFNIVYRSYDIYGAVNVEYINFAANGYSDSYGAWTLVPTNGYPGGQMKINSTKYLSQSKKRNTAMHEIGHAVNFHHTTWYQPSSGSYVECSHHYAQHIMYERTTAQTYFSDCEKNFFRWYY